MTNTLLNTVSSRNTNFLTMNYMLPAQQKLPAVQSPVVNNDVTSSQAPAVNAKPVPAQKEKLIKDDKTRSLLIGLGGLAVIGAGSVLLYNKLQKGKAGSENSPLVQAKNKAKDEYKKLKENLLAEFNENLPEDLKVRKGVRFNSSKELEDFKEALKTGDDFSVEKYEKMQTGALSSVKSHLARLDSDGDWKELRKLRKTLIKSADAQDDAGKIAREKIYIINDLMAYKVDNSREQVFKNRNMMDVQDAFNLVRRDFGSLNEFNAEKAKVTKYDFDFDAGEGFFAGHKPLVINDLFEDEQDTYNFARDNLNKIKNICTEVIPKAKEDLHKKLTELAQNFRTSEFIANLRNLTGKSA